MRLSCAGLNHTDAVVLCPGPRKSWSPGRSEREVHADSRRPSAERREASGKTENGASCPLQDCSHVSFKTRFKAEWRPQTFQTCNTHPQRQPEEKCNLCFGYYLELFYLL